MNSIVIFRVTIIGTTVKALKFAKLLGYTNFNHPWVKLIVYC